MRTPERLETKRLILRPYSKGYTNDLLDRYIVYNLGFSLAIFSKDSDEPWGICSLEIVEDDEEFAAGPGGAFVDGAALRPYAGDDVDLEVPERLPLDGLEQARHGAPAVAVQRRDNHRHPRPPPRGRTVCTFHAPQYTPRPAEPPTAASSVSGQRSSSRGIISTWKRGGDGNELSDQRRN